MSSMKSWLSCLLIFDLPAINGDRLDTEEIALGLGRRCKERQPSLWLPAD